MQHKPPNQGFIRQLTNRRIVPPSGKRVRDTPFLLLWVPPKKTHQTKQSMKAEDLGHTHSASSLCSPMSPDGLILWTISPWYPLLLWKIQFFLCLLRKGYLSSKDRESRHKSLFWALFKIRNNKSLKTVPQQHLQKPVMFPAAQWPEKSASFIARMYETGHYF